MITMRDLVHQLLSAPQRKTTDPSVQKTANRLDTTCEVCGRECQSYAGYRKHYLMMHVKEE